MKPLSIPWVLFLIICLSCSTDAQVQMPRLIIVSLNQDLDSLAMPSNVNLVPGDTLQFVAEKGDFDILITNAYKFLKIAEDDLKVRIDSSNLTKSAKYVVRKIKEYNTKYSIYCISNKSWPVSPPKIIINTN